MKKVVSLALAAAMAASMASVAFAALPTVGTVGDSNNTDPEFNGPTHLVTPSGVSAKDNEYYTYLYSQENGDSFTLNYSSKGVTDTIWKYDDSEVNLYLITLYDDDKPQVHVKDGDITTSMKTVGKDYTLSELDKLLDVGGSTDYSAYKYGNKNDGGIFNVYKLTIKSNAGVRMFEKDDYTVEIDYDRASYDPVYATTTKGGATGISIVDGKISSKGLTVKTKGKYGYSDIRDVESGERYNVVKSQRLSPEETTGSMFNFSESISKETRIRCHDYVDLYFKGNYGTDKENLRVVTDDIKEVEDFFEDYDIDYYDFVGTPKFAKDVTVIIDADSDAYIYEYDKKTGDVVDITDQCTYESDGMKFARKTFKTYVIMEEPYEGGNVKAEKEPIEEEPDVVEPADDDNAQGTKPNPGTGAYPA